MKIKRGQIYYADLSPAVGSEQSGARPVLVVSNDIGNHFSPIVIVAPLTSRISKKRLPTQVIVQAQGLKSISMVECEQVRVLDKLRLSTYLGYVEDMAQINQALKVSLGV